MRREEEAVQKPYAIPFRGLRWSVVYSRMDASSLPNDAAAVFASAHLLLRYKPFGTSCGTNPRIGVRAFQSRIFLRHFPEEARDIPMKLSSTFVATAFLLGSLAAVAQQPAPALTGDAKPDTGAMAADVYSNQLFGFSYRVPSQWTGKAI